MNLSKIIIQNFRSIKSLEITLQPGLNVFVGRNNTGKTSILQAIRHAVGPAASQGDPLWLDEDDFYKESAASERAEVITVILIFEGLTEEQRTAFYEIVDFDLTDINNSKAILKYEATWPQNKRQATVKRTGGPRQLEMQEVPQRILENIPITFLPALRDAEAALAPGYKSRLATLLRDRSDRKGKKDEERIVSIYKEANNQLSQDELVKEVVTDLIAITTKIAGSDALASKINAAEANFNKILRTLQVQMEDAPIASLSANGLGLNNLIYISIVLQHLKSISKEECPLLLVEEPEAHLHPQLTLLLSEYLSEVLPASKAPQTLITTHSPTLVTSIPVKKMHVLFRTRNDKSVKCNSLLYADLSDSENRMLQRMMDITRSTLYFARGAILVEGLSESLLIPILAKRMTVDLAKLQISVIPICGIAFGIFKKLLNPNVLGIPVAIITDADPPINRKKDGNWESDEPETEGGEIKISDRTKNLIKEYKELTNVSVFYSELTLEYDLAKAGDTNAALIANAWEKCFVGHPGTFNTKKVNESATTKDKALAAWRGICRADNIGSKADLAQNLADLLSIKKADKWENDFTSPQYIVSAIEFVKSQINE